MFYGNKSSNKSSSQGLYYICFELYGKVSTKRKFSKSSDQPAVVSVLTIGLSWYLSFLFFPLSHGTVIVQPLGCHFENREENHVSDICKTLQLWYLWFVYKHMFKEQFVTNSNWILVHSNTTLIQYDCKLCENWDPFWY